MLFNSLLYLIFFPLFAFLYLILPKRLQIIFLFLVSLGFYIAVLPSSVFTLFAVILVTFFGGMVIAKTEGINRKAACITTALVNCAILIISKYLYFFATIFAWIFSEEIASSQPQESFLIPLGLSFYVLQAISYLVDVSKKKYSPEKNLGFFSLYIMFFPKVIAGPIERADTLLPQFRENHTFEYNRVTNGLKRIAWGVFKKVVIADRLALFVAPVFADPYSHSGMTLIVATLFFAYQLYADFSGYTDMAVGSAQVLGFRLSENFNRPYFSVSIFDFWQRWHVTFSSWLRDYIYISLGGNKVSLFRWQTNILITFLVSGLWHGAQWTFILWGLLHGCFIILTRAAADLGKSRFLFLSKVSFLSPIITFTFVCFSWIFFRAESVQDALYITTHLFSGTQTYLTHSINYIGSYHELPLEAIFTPILVGQRISDLLIVVGGIVVMELFYIAQGSDNLWEKLQKKPLAMRWALYAYLLWAIFIFGVLDTNEFLYETF